MNLVREAGPEAEEGLVMQALEQTGGRGRFGNQWSSPPGNLYMSVLLRPGKSMEDSGQLAFVAGVAVARALETGTSGLEPRLKWPNDVLRDGRKLAGLLIEYESRLAGFILGIGLNVHSPPEGCAGLADTSLSVDCIRDQILTQLKHDYHRWHVHGFAPLREAWLSRAANMGQKVSARLPEGVIEGIFEGLDDRGALVMLNDRGQHIRITSAEIQLGNVSGALQER